MIFYGEFYGILVFAPSYSLNTLSVYCYYSLNMLSMLSGLPFYADTPSVCHFRGIRLQKSV